MDTIEILQEGKVLSRIFTASGLDQLPECLPQGRGVYVVYDHNTRSLLDKMDIPGLRATMAIDASEASKNLATVSEICDFLLREGADRHSFLLAIGGGITTDMAGFAASIFKRGISFGFVPTTLLSMVDAAIGGKNGVNFLNYKNMLGVIRQPLFTFICQDCLGGLPRRDFLSGAAEMLKTFIIENAEVDGKDNYSRAVELLSSSNAEPAELLLLIKEAARVKAGVVGRDQFESGERRLLNLGHTFAHAIEHGAQEDGNDITHGEAVAMGMVLAARLSEKLSVAPEGLAKKIEEDFVKCALPVECPYPMESLAQAMGLDKKAEGSRVRFVLIDRIGHCSTQSLDPAEVAKYLI